MVQEAEICALCDLTMGMVVQLLEAQKKKRIPFIFNDESTGSCIWRLRHIHVNTMRV
jgi:hypothetical protein